MWSSVLFTTLFISSKAQENNNFANVRTTEASSFCGGIGSGAFQCADGLYCVDDPSDDCDPNFGGADCSGICVAEGDSCECTGQTALCPCGLCTDGSGNTYGCCECNYVLNDRSTDLTCSTTITSEADVCIADQEPTTTDDICSLAPEVGDCDAVIDRFYWDSETEACESFIYGGCGGNENNFESEETCLRTCCERAEMCTYEYAPVCCDGVAYSNACAAMCVANCVDGECDTNSELTTTATEEEPTRTDQETTATEEEPTRGDQETTAATDEEQTRTDQETTADICSLAQVVGPCEAAMPRFYWNSETGTCESFTYGGCDGNENNFEFEDECLSACCDAPDVCTDVYAPVCCDGVEYSNECKAESVCAANCVDGECETEEPVTTVDDDSCESDDDCDDGYSCKFRNGCVPPDWAAQTTAIGNCDGNGLRNGICVEDPDYCEIEATVDAFTGLMVFSNRAGVANVWQATCRWCICVGQGERGCYNLNGNDVARLAALDDTEVERIFNSICNSSDYPDLADEDGDQCEWLDIRLKDDSEISECWCSALICESNINYVWSGVKGYGVMVGIGFVMAMFVWM